MNKPAKLRKGDLVALVTTSYPVKSTVISKSKEYLESLGLTVRIGKHASHSIGFMGGYAEERASDLMEMFLDDDVRGIFINGGGRTASQILPFLNFKEIGLHPKIFMALSNPSILANAITSKSDFITFHGPTGYNFGEAGMTPFTEKHMVGTIIEGLPIGEVEQYRPAEVLQRGSGIAKGRLYGGHLLTTRSLLGTPYAPDWNGIILFLEDCFEELHDFDDSLTHFRLAGVFDKIAGLVIGTPESVIEKTFPEDETMQDIVMRICADYTFPILYGIDIGHTDNKVTLPIGALAELDSKRGTLTISEAVVNSNS